MKVAIATTEDDMLGGVFAQAYHEAGGPPPHTVFILPERNDLRFPRWAAGVVALKLLGPIGTVRIVSARHGHLPLYRADRNIGLNRDWIPTLASAETHCVYCNSMNDSDTLAGLKDIQPDLLVSIGVPIILKKQVLTIPRIGAVNVHNGRLPKYRGHFGTFWEVHQGETWAYTSIHVMTAKVDAGRLLATERVNIEETQSFLDLMLEKKRRGGRLLAQVLCDIERQGSFPDQTPPPDEPDTGPGYFGWPSLRDVLSFSFRAKRQPTANSVIHLC